MSNSVFIIAEAGVNHNGSIEIAKKLVEAACFAGADAIKFQTFKAEKIVCASAEKAEYQLSATDNKETQLQMLKKLELSYDDHIEIINYCKKNRIAFLSTPFDLDSIDLLNKLDVMTFKIPSGEITNLPYLRALGKLNKKIILSTGMANLEEVRAAYRILIDSGTDYKNIIILHATTEYPTPFKNVNLKAMQTIANELNVQVGYSDHTLGIEVAIAAVSMGAVIIEKHFTLDKTMLGPDHKASLEAGELKAMVSAIRNIEISIGNGIKIPSTNELANMPIVRKSIVALKNIMSGDIFNESNLTVKRPGTGISPMKWDEIIGEIAKRDYAPDDLIEI